MKWPALRLAGTARIWYFRHKCAPMLCISSTRLATADQGLPIVGLREIMVRHLLHRPTTCIPCLAGHLV